MLLAHGGTVPAQTPKQPAGASAQIAQGAEHYQPNCALCHGVDGQGGKVFPRPIWGRGHDLAKFGNARGLFEYMRLLMPFDDPQKMSDEQKWAVIAYMLERNGTIKAPDTLEPAKAAGIAIK